MTKISQLPEITSVTNDDLFVVINDPAGSPATRRVTAQNLLQFVESGIGVTPVSDGGTGATNASDARTNLGLPHTFGTGGTSVVAWQAGSNSAAGDWSVVSGGSGNASVGALCSIGGGGSNTAYDYASMVGGGTSNTASSIYGAVCGGRSNRAEGSWAAVVGGSGNSAVGENSSIIGGTGITATGAYSTVGGGFYNTGAGQNSAVCGGKNNATQGIASFIGGGESNVAAEKYGTVAGGLGNEANGRYGFVGGGKSNTASGLYATIPGGRNNTAAHDNVFLIGSNLISDANDTTYVENLNVKNKLILSTPISVANGGTGSTNTADLADSLGFGTLALQNQDNVAITGGTISIDGLFNVGLGLSSNSFSTAKVTARSAITDMTSVADVPIFTVPSGCMFMIDTMEIVTISITDPGLAPIVRFGLIGLEDVFYSPARTTSNSFGERHVVENPQNGVDAGSVVSFGITEASTAAAHSGFAIVTGYLLKKT